MTTGSQSDMLNRILANMPSQWLPQSSDATPPSVASPVTAALMTGPASAFSSVYAQIQYVILQLRVATATGYNLDIIALDYFGLTLARRPGEADAPFSARIRANFFLPKGTRAAVSLAVETLTGVAPQIFEPMNPSDTGGYGNGSGLHPHKWMGMAYGYAGGYGSMNYPYQMFLQTNSSDYSINPVAGVNGYSGYLSGYGVGAGEYVDGEVNTGSVTDSDIYSAIAETIAAGTVCWVSITP